MDSRLRGNDTVLSWRTGTATMDSRLRGNDAVLSWRTGTATMDSRLSRHRSPPSFPQSSPRHSREGGNPLGIPVIHTGAFFLNQPNLPYPVPFFRRFYVERSVGFVSHDVDRGCFMIGAPLWIPALRGNDTVLSWRTSTATMDSRLRGNDTVLSWRTSPQQPWIPAYAGMTQCSYGERAQQPWIRLRGNDAVLSWRTGTATMDSRHSCAGLPRHSRKAPPSFPRRRESITEHLS